VFNENGIFAMTVVNDIIALMEKIAPGHLAEDWDNSGLQIGDRNWQVNNVLVALDPSLSVVKSACQKNMDLLITHHPLIFTPLKSLILDTPLGEIIELSVRNRLAIFSAHTNLDSVKGGLNDFFADKIGLKNLSVFVSDAVNPLHPDGFPQGIGRVGELETPTSLAAFSEKIKSEFSLSTLKVSGPLDMTVKKIAVCTGSGSGLMKQFFATDADVYITGDLKFHDAKDAQMNHRGLIDVGHFASESIMIDLIADRLAAQIKENGLDIRVEALNEEEDPFQYF
jgi:dinuclear metal center YbgI/SA1388 family protein